MFQQALISANEISEQIRAWRRHLHAFPELSGHETQTARFVAARLREIGLEPRENVGGVSGLTAEIRVDDRPALALRADMDALPIHEETGLEFASKTPGVMHACGHDAHTAMLLGAARILLAQKARLKRSVRFIFQPAEELYPGGAQPMIAGGALDGVSEIFGLHISSRLPTGQLGARTGPAMSAVNLIDITIQGRGTHAAMPEAGVDPVVVAAAIILSLQTVVSRSIAMTDCAVVSITQVEAGTAHNVIPERVRLGGTIRTLDEVIRGKVLARVTELVESIARAHGAMAIVQLHPGYPVLINHAQPIEAARAAARAVGINDPQHIDVPPQGGGEDFAYYLQKVPGAFVFLGAQNEAKNCVYPHHHPKFNIDEDSLPTGAALLAQYALDSKGE